MTRLRAFLRGATSLLLLVMLVAGLPWALVRWGQWPHGTSGGSWWERLTGSAISDTAVVVVLTLAATAIWALFVISVAVELVAALRGRQARRIVLAGPLQRGARGLVVAVLFAFSAPLPAAAPTPAQPMALPSAVLVSRHVAGPGTAQVADPTPTPRSPATDSRAQRSVAAPSPFVAASAPVETTPPGETSAPSPTPGTVSVITVMPGDSAWELAATHLGDGMRWRELWEINRGVPQPDGGAWTDPQLLLPGWQLQLPAMPTDVAVDSAADSVDDATVYVVVAGDTLSGIADRLLGDAARYPEVFELNRDRVQPDGDRLVDPNLIRPGWQLRIPGLTSPPAETPAPAPFSPAPFPAPSTSPPSPLAPEAAPSTPPDTTPSTAPSNETAPLPPRSVPRPGSPTPAASPATNHTEPSVSLIATLSGVAVLAAGLAVRCVRLRRRRALRGGAHSEIAATQAERAVLDTADVPLVRWAGQRLAQLLTQLEHSELSSGPIAVELSPDSGIELLWDAPQRAPAPAAWQVADGGWAWRLAYDPDAPVPADTLCAGIPALVTLGTRDGRHLLIDLEAFGVLTVSGPEEQVDNWLRAVAWELASGDDLTDAYVATADLALGTDTSSAPARLTDTTSDQVLATVCTARRAIGNALDEAQIRDSFQARTGHVPPLEATIGILTANSPATLAELIPEIPPRCGAAVIVATDQTLAETAPARVMLHADGTGHLLPLDLPFHAAQLPLPTATALDATLNDLADLETPPGLPTESSPPAVPLVLVVDDVSANASDVAASDRADVQDTASGSPSKTERVPPEIVPVTFIDAPVMTPSVTDDALPTHASNGHRLDDETIASDPPESVVVPVDGVEPCRCVEMVVRVLGVPSVPDRPNLGRRELIFAVLLACRGELAASAVQDALWGAKPVEPKTVWNLIASARRALGALPDGAPVVPTVDRAERLRLDPRVTTDLAIVTSRLDEARAASSTDAIRLLHEALDWIDGPPFDAPGYDWAHRDQDVAHASVLIEQTVDTLVVLALEHDHVDDARTAIARGLRGLPGNEALYRLRMQVEHHAGRHDAVIAAYDELSSHLGEFDAEPSGLTAALYHDLVGRPTRR